MMKCICGSQELRIKSEKESITIGGNEYFYDAEFYRCENCGEELYTAAQSKAEDSKIAEIKRRAAGFLTPREIVSLRERHGLTQEQASAIFGGGRNAFSKYERGEAYPSKSMDNLMKLFDECVESKKRLISKSDLPEKEKNYLQSASLAREVEKILPAQHIFIFENYVHAVIPVNDSATSWGKK